MTEFYDIRVNGKHVYYATAKYIAFNNIEMMTRRHLIKPIQDNIPRAKVCNNTEGLGTGNIFKVKDINQTKELYCFGNANCFDTLEEQEAFAIQFHKDKANKHEHIRLNKAIETILNTMSIEEVENILKELTQRQEAKNK